MTEPVDNNNTAIVPSEKIKLGTRKVGLAAKLAGAKESNSLQTLPSQMPHRIFISFDNSGSMSSFWEDQPNSADRRAIDVAKEACKHFIDVCNPLDTAIGFHTFGNDKVIEPTTMYPVLQSAVKTFEPTGGTPLYGSVLKCLNHDFKPTRICVISDGEPTDDNNYSFYTDEERVSSSNKEKAIAAAIAAKTPVDTVFIGSKHATEAITKLRELADRTGGMFIHFENAQSFAAKFKYLAPAYYAMLTSGEIKL